MNLIQSNPKIPPGRDEIHICIPSRGRADRVVSRHAISNAVLFVSETQEKEYKKRNPDIEIISHPESAEVPHPVNKWQWILDYYGGGNVWFIDDDIVSMDCLTPSKRSRRLSPEGAWERVQVTGWACKDAGLYMFGFNNTCDPRNYNGLNPFPMKGMVWGCGMGILPGGGLFFNPHISEGEMFIALLNAYKHRQAFIDKRFGLYAGQVTQTYKDTGGMAYTRSTDTLKSSHDDLIKMFGNVVCKKASTARSRQRHDHQITIRLPF